MLNDYWKSVAKQQHEWESLKNAVRERDLPICSYCGINVEETASPVDIDHVIAKIKGGLDRLDNLVLSCSSCNRSKGSRNWTVKFDRRTREEQLDIFARIGVTKEAYQLLRADKKKQKLSLAKLASTIIINYYDNETRQKR